MARNKSVPASKRSSARFIARVIKGAEPGPYPGFVEPSLPTLRSAPPKGDGWVHELKIDGYRTQLHVVGERARIFTRRGHDWTHRFSPIAADAASLPANEVVLDGEIAVSDANGVTSFSSLIADIGKGRGDRLAFYAFDLLYLDGFDLRKSPLLERKRVLAEFLAETSGQRIFFTDHYETDGAALVNHICLLGMEGVVSKRTDASYRSGRTLQWLKIKCRKEETLPIIGFIPAPGSIAALYLGRHDGDVMTYAGKAGTGFTVKAARELRKKLNEVTASISPVHGLKKKEATWVHPVYEAKVEYADISEDGLLRHSSFKGLANPTMSRRIADPTDH